MPRRRTRQRQGACGSGRREPPPRTQPLAHNEPPFTLTVALRLSCRLRFPCLLDGKDPFPRSRQAGCRQLRRRIDAVARKMWRTSPSGAACPLCTPTSADLTPTPHMQGRMARSAARRWATACCAVLLGMSSLGAAEMTSMQRKQLCTGLKRYECRVALLEFEVRPSNLVLGLSAVPSIWSWCSAMTLTRHDE